MILLILNICFGSLLFFLLIKTFASVKHHVKNNKSSQDEPCLNCFTFIFLIFGNQTVIFHLHLIKLVFFDNSNPEIGWMLKFQFFQQMTFAFLRSFCLTRNKEGEDQDAKNLTSWTDKKRLNLEFFNNLYCAVFMFLAIWHYQIENEIFGYLLYGSIIGNIMFKMITLNKLSINDLFRKSTKICCCCKCCSEGKGKTGNEKNDEIGHADNIGFHHEYVQPTAPQEENQVSPSAPPYSSEPDQRSRYGNLTAEEERLLAADESEREFRFIVRNASSTML